MWQKYNWLLMKYKLWNILCGQKCKISSKKPKPTSLVPNPAALLKKVTLTLTRAWRECEHGRHPLNCTRYRPRVWDSIYYQDSDSQSRGINSPNPQSKKSSIQRESEVNKKDREKTGTRGRYQKRPEPNRVKKTEKQNQKTVQLIGFRQWQVRK